jgi:hypothetical protein
MRRIAILACIAAMALGTLAAGAQQKQQKPYVPSLADLMLTLQLRHIKLWLSGSASNWELANFAVHEIEEGLETAAELHPTYKDSPISRMIEDTVKAPIEDIEKAIKAQNRAAFVSAYDKLTAACNACHQASNHAFIVIQRPATSPFPNQTFAPAKK